ncbi:MAG: glycyl-radical enzyme activating protein [Chloroflexi bacterium]|nr:glycyl-radical enzyme activating protein [Chloroflexota bacterium]
MGYPIAVSPETGSSADRKEVLPRRGLLFNIQRFSIHDGPGIRTTVFFKGCPLRCRWCSNPESWHDHPEIATYAAKCTRCGRCQKVCPVNAIAVSDRERTIDRQACNLCLKCGEVCPTGAIAITGQWMTVAEVMKEVEADGLFYVNSGGGVTLSGGEPLAQWEFALDLLRECQAKAFHTALDTCGYALWEVLDKVLDYTDLVLYDIKHMDPGRHTEGTGKTNGLILDNARRTAAKRRTWLRVPLIPGYNDSVENLEAVARFGLEIGAEKVSLLPYHVWGQSKWERLGRKYPLEALPMPPESWAGECRKVIESLGLKATVGR